MEEESAATGDIIPIDDPRDIRAVGFDGLSKEERHAMAMRGVAARRRRAMERKLAELEVYREAHKELAAQILGAKSSLLDGLIHEMDDGQGGLDTTKLDARRMALLMQLMESLETRAFGKEATKTENHTTVDIRALTLDLTKRLSRPDDV
jgi:hypothetical protein